MDLMGKVVYKNDVEQSQAVYRPRKWVKYFPQSYNIFDVIKNYHWSSEQTIRPNISAGVLVLVPELTFDEAVDGGASPDGAAVAMKLFQAATDALGPTYVDSVVADP